MSTESRTRHGVQVYARFRDDIIVVLDDPFKCPGFDLCLTDFAKPMYSVQKESFSEVSCCMLDLRIYKQLCGDGVHRLRWQPFIKPTARHAPLTSSSCHSKKCHGSWPLAEISRMYSRSFHDRSFRLFKEIKVSRFSHFFLSQEVLRNCEKWQPKLPLNLGLGVVRDKPRIIRIILPFSSRWEGIQRRLQRVHAEWSDTLCKMGLAFVIQVGFSKGSQPLWSRVRHLGFSS